MTTTPDRLERIERRLDYLTCRVDYLVQLVQALQSLPPNPQEKVVGIRVNPGSPIVRDEDASTSP